MPRLDGSYYYITLHLPIFRFISAVDNIVLRDKKLKTIRGQEAKKKKINK